jgi:hypothetical protein
MKHSNERDAAQKYTLQGDRNRNFLTGRIPGNRQVLVVIHYPYLVAIVFDLEGKVTCVQKRLLSTSTQELALRLGLDEAMLEQGNEELATWLNDLGYCPGKITVRKFLVPEHHIGITDFPEHLLAVLREVDTSDDERQFAKSELKQWATKGLFILWLNKSADLWINGQGEVEAS